MSPAGSGSASPAPTPVPAVPPPTPVMSTTTNDTFIEKAAHAVTKLKGRDNWRIWSTTMRIALGRTWAYVAGDKSESPEQSSPDYGMWVEENSNAHRRIWLGLDDDVKQAILPHADSHASQLFAALKSLYEPQGATAEYYARRKYENVKISDHDNLGDFMTELINAAHQFNKEVADVSGRIKDRDIALRIIHDLPGSMHTLQTILLETAPPSSNTQWDLQALR